MKKIFTSILLTLSILYVNSIDYIINDKVVTFNIPEKYDELKKYYLKIIDAYVTVLRNNYKLEKEINNIENKNKELNKILEDMNYTINSLNNNIKELNLEINRLKNNKTKILQIYSIPSFNMDYNITFDVKNTFDIIVGYNMLFVFFDKVGVFGGIGIGTRIPQYTIYYGNIIFDATLGFSIKVR